MTFFRRDNGPEPASAAPRSSPPSKGPAPSDVKTLIAAGTKVSGQINGDADLVVEGEFEGKVQLASDVSIGNRGRVKGEIVARSVRIGGRMLGDVRGTDVVEIGPSGSLEGNVMAARVIISEGAFFKGQVEMTGGSDSAKPAAQPSASPPPSPPPSAQTRPQPDQHKQNR